MANQYGTYVKGNLFRGNYKAPGGTMHTPRTGYSKAANVGYDAAYYGMLGYGLSKSEPPSGQQGGRLARASWQRGAPCSEPPPRLPKRP